MSDKDKHGILNTLLATVWLVNGLMCKVLNVVPRHEQIVARILGNDYSSMLTILIGFSEIMMALWILTKIKPKLNAIIQIILITTMNILEFVLAPDLLLWSKVNLLFALVFIAIIYYNEFVLRRKLNL